MYHPRPAVATLNICAGYDVDRPGKPRTRLVEPRTPAQTEDVSQSERFRATVTWPWRGRGGTASASTGFHRSKVQNRPTVRIGHRGRGDVDHRRPSPRHPEGGGDLTAGHHWSQDQRATRGPPTLATTAAPTVAQRVRSGPESFTHARLALDVPRGGDGRPSSHTFSTVGTRWRGQRCPVSVGPVQGGRLSRGRGPEPAWARRRGRIWRAAAHRRRSWATSCPGTSVNTVPLMCLPTILQITPDKRSGRHYRFGRSREPPELLDLREIEAALRCHPGVVRKRDCGRRSGPRLATWLRPRTPAEPTEERLWRDRRIRE